eukprot:g28289.t1
MGQDFGKGTDEHEAGAQYPQPVAPRKCIITPASNGTKCVQTEHGAIANGAKIQLGDIRHRNNPASYLPQGPARKWASINLLDIQPDDQAQQWIVEEGVVKSALDPSLCLHLRLARTVKGTSIFLWRYRRNLFMAHQSFVIRYLNEIPVNQAVEQAMGAEAKTTQLSVRDFYPGFKIAITVQDRKSRGVFQDFNVIRDFYRPGYHNPPLGVWVYDTPGIIPEACAMLSSISSFFAFLYGLSSSLSPIPLSRFSFFHASLASFQPCVTIYLVLLILAAFPIALPNHIIPPNFVLSLQNPPGIYPPVSGPTSLPSSAAWCRIPLLSQP